MTGEERRQRSLARCGQRRVCDSRLQHAKVFLNKEYISVKSPTNPRHSHRRTDGSGFSLPDRRCCAVTEPTDVRHSSPNDAEEELCPESLVVVQDTNRFSGIRRERVRCDRGCLCCCSAGTVDQRATKQGVGWTVRTLRNTLVDCNACCQWYTRHSPEHFC